MSRFQTVFARAREENRAALIIYICAGDPDLATTPNLVLAAAEAGADIIELGVPFSDPTADGVAIQRASERALRGRTSLPGVLEAARAVRKKSDVPLLLFGYYNPILAYGEARLAKDAVSAGIDGLLVVDLPPEESESLRSPALAAGLDYVPLVAPTSNDARVAAAASVATSFVYYVSLTGVTGAAGTDLEDAARRAVGVREKTGRPVALGFGVKSPADVRRVVSHVDGVVVGSAIVQTIEKATDAHAAIDAVRSCVAALAEATRR